MSSSYRSIQQIGFVTLGPLRCVYRRLPRVVLLEHGGVVLMAFKPNLDDQLFFKCFDTVGLVIWPVKVVPEMIYNVLSGTLSLYTTITTAHFRSLLRCLHESDSRTAAVYSLQSVS